jgi:hypothetical protein
MSAPKTAANIDPKGRILQALPQLCLYRSDATCECARHALRRALDLRWISRGSSGPQFGCVEFADTMGDERGRTKKCVTPEACPHVQGSWKARALRLAAHVISADWSQNDRRRCRCKGRRWQGRSPRRRDWAEGRNGRRSRGRARISPRRSGPARGDGPVGPAADQPLVAVGADLGIARDPTRNPGEAPRGVTGGAIAEWGSPRGLAWPRQAPAITPSVYRRRSLGAFAASGQ